MSGTDMRKIMEAFKGEVDTDALFDAAAANREELDENKNHKPDCKCPFCNKDDKEEKDEKDENADNDAKKEEDEIEESIAAQIEESILHEGYSPAEYKKHMMQEIAFCDGEADIEIVDKETIRFVFKEDPSNEDDDTYYYEFKYVGTWERD